MNNTDSLSEPSVLITTSSPFYLICPHTYRIPLTPLTDYLTSQTLNVALWSPWMWNHCTQILFPRESLQAFHYHFQFRQDEAMPPTDFFLQLTGLTLRNNVFLFQHKNLNLGHLEENFILCSAKIKFLWKIH